VLKPVYHAAIAAAAILGGAAAAEAMRPRTMMAETERAIDFAAALPDNFGGWTRAPSVRLVEPVEADNLANQTYSQMVGRAYTDRDGNMVMLLIAYGPRQSDRLQLHRPETCYLAEGFQVTRPTPSTVRISPGIRPFELRRMVAQRERRFERITYWMRIGDDIASNLIERQLVKLRYGLAGVIPDGVLVRVSTLNIDNRIADALHDRFLADLMRAIDKGSLRHFVGRRQLETGVGQHGRARPGSA
jgi:EpsI family protein